MAWTEISQLTSPTAGAFTFTSLSLGSYDFIKVLMNGITVTTDDTEIVCTFYVSSSEVTTGYRWATHSVSSSSSENSDGDQADPDIHLMSNNAAWGVGNATNESFMGEIIVGNPAGTSLFKNADFHCSHVAPSGAFVSTYGAGIMENTGAIDGIRIKGDSSLTAGKVTILGWS